MKMQSVAVAIGLSLVSLPGFCQGLVSSEKYSDNPMNGVGVAHNAYAGCIATVYDPKGKTTPIELLVYRCGFPTQGAPEAFITKYGQLVDQSAGDPKLSLVANLKPYRASFSEEQFSYFEDIDQILGTAKDPEDADRLLKTLEQQAAKALGRADSDLTVLGAISTTRHSLELWSQDQVATASSTQRGFPWQLIVEVVVADVSGYASGSQACGKICGIAVGIVKSISAAL